MRVSTQKLLLLLYSQNTNQPVKLKLNYLNWLLPELTPSGVRSLTHLLKRNGLVTEVVLDGTRWLSLTHKGQEALIESFPALSLLWDSWQGEWCELVFLTPPKGDKQFRYLRSYLIKQKALPLTRGVYLVPKGFFTLKFESLIKRVYLDSVMVMDLVETDLGYLRPIVVNYYMLEELYSSYSGISRELRSLLDTVEAKKRLTSSDRKKILFLVDQLRLSLESDLGVIGYYFPDVPRVKDVLKQLQLILSI